MGAKQSQFNQKDDDSGIIIIRKGPQSVGQGQKLPYNTVIGSHVSAGGGFSVKAALGFGEPSMPSADTAYITPRLLNDPFLVELRQIQMKGDEPAASAFSHVSEHKGDLYGGSESIVEKKKGESNEEVKEETQRRSSGTIQDEMNNCKNFDGNISNDKINHSNHNHHHHHHHHHQHHDDIHTPNVQPHLPIRCNPNPVGGSGNGDGGGCGGDGCASGSNENECLHNSHSVSDQMIFYNSGSRPGNIPPGVGTLPPPTAPFPSLHFFLHPPSVDGKEGDFHALDSDARYSSSTSNISNDKQRLYSSQTATGSSNNRSNFDSHSHSIINANYTNQNFQSNNSGLNRYILSPSFFFNAPASILPGSISNLIGSTPLNPESSSSDDLALFDDLQTFLTAANQRGDGREAALLTAEIKSEFKEFKEWQRISAASSATPKQNSIMTKMAAADQATLEAISKIKLAATSVQKTNLALSNLRTARQDLLELSSKLSSLKGSLESCKSVASAAAAATAHRNELNRLRRLKMQENYNLQLHQASHTIFPTTNHLPISSSSVVPSSPLSKPLPLTLSVSHLSPHSLSSGMGSLPIPSSSTNISHQPHSSNNLPPRASYFPSGTFARGSNESRLGSKKVGPNDGSTGVEVRVDEVGTASYDCSQKKDKPSLFQLYKDRQLAKSEDGGSRVKDPFKKVSEKDNKMYRFEDKLDYSDDEIQYGDKNDGIDHRSKGRYLEEIFIEEAEFS